jgi:cytochrome b561
MPLRNGDHGYGLVTKSLHWLTVLALAAQFTVGYLMEVDDSGRGRGRGRGRGGESGRGRGRGGEEEDLLESIDGLVAVHVTLGVVILVLAVARVAWRRTGLPPWAETLRAGERTLAHWTERALLLLLFVIPPTGALVLLVDDDWLPLHVASHIALFVALTAHLGLVLKHQLLDRDRLIGRML